MNKTLRRMLATLLISAFILTMTGCVVEIVEDTSGTATEKPPLEETETTAAATTEQTTAEAVTEAATESTAEITTEATTETTIEEVTLDANMDIEIDGSYTTMEDVALYIHTYDCLPENFMTKREARELGWEGGSLEPYAPGMCIGGDYFGNYESLLPEERGREYHECDINTLGASSRGAERIIYSNDGLIYYTADHYESFTLIYGEE